MAPLQKFVKVAFIATAPNYESTSKPVRGGSRINIGATSSLSVSGLDVASKSLEEMCGLFKAEPADNLYLTSSGERGVCVYKPVKKGDVVLSIPVSSCFRDDEPPRWYEHLENNEATEDEHDITDYERYSLSGWASRLAASVLDLELNNSQGEIQSDDDLKKGREMWKSMLPDEDILRASLPVHWGEEIVGSAKCTALELAIDSAYFARATTVFTLTDELKQVLEDERKEKGEIPNVDLERKCHDALDIVQTRACRLERKCEDGVQWGPPLRILAPIFDFINHASSRTTGKGSANAEFGVENEHMCDMHEAKLVVRALRDIDEGEEVLIDYGDSARPAWRCLTSYGFVPDYDLNADVSDEEPIENVAELWMNGLRFDVDPNSVPYDLVEVAAAQTMLDYSVDENEFTQEEEEIENGMLTPLVARTIADRATEAAINLVIETEDGNAEEDVWDAPEFVQAASLAHRLRWSQHEVLMKFAMNLRGLCNPEPEEEN
eukprot:CAMPEP_0201691888 /NCGR_PEP_ID=MMETSP0578-20130828/4923_1 /ASSEMBLY_ACC=CAM_ASM_000663 /TAXON_ID=267565 /ORGANISM="Skeletonema grethea, Strain CCMP 1804" /LENGTH=492 /DNA_ID=CAMNT_0048177167 /DNA_START=7 /DNA_END=1485 /DNA_ORIENTATION=-